MYAWKRRVIQKGTGSYGVTLPKDWVAQMNLKKGDYIHISLTPDGSLLLTPAGVKKTAEEQPEANQESGSLEDIMGLNGE